MAACWWLRSWKCASRTAAASAAPLTQPSVCASSS
jgi:hypothetical protein